MTPERKKEFKVYAIIAVILLAITGFRLGIHEMQQRALKANMFDVPWEAGKKNEYMRDLENRINQNLPTGTDANVIKEWMKANGYLEDNAPCIGVSVDKQPDTICFRKTLWKGPEGSESQIVDVLIKDHKVQKIEFSGERMIIN